MTEETTGQPEVVEVTPEIQEAPTPEVAESSTEHQPEPAKPVDEEFVPRRRLDKTVWQREEALRKVARLEEENTRLKMNREPTKPEPVDQSKPRPEQFQDFAEYTEALADWKVRGHIQKAREEYLQRTQQEQMGSALKAFNERVDKVRVKFPDYDDLFERASISEAMAPTILESESGPELAVYLAKNPEVAKKLYHLGPREAARELGRIEAKLDDLLQVKSVTDAKPPLSPVKPKGDLPEGLDDKLDIKTWMKRREKQLGR